MRDALVRLSAEHPGATLVVDLDGVAFLDSMGLGVLVGGLRRMRASGGDLALVCAAPRLLELLSLCGLDRVFAIHPTIADFSEVIQHGG